MIYLDHAATTPVHPQVIEQMVAVMQQHGANPSSTHPAGQAVAALLEKAAQQVAASIHGQPEDIIWTSGATEATNLALKGVIDFYGQGHVISTVIEHNATLNTLNWLEQRGNKITRLGVNSQGQIDLAELAAAIQPDTRCVSIMHVNNETGAVQNLAAIGELCAKHNVLLHVDAAQSFGKLAVDVEAMQIDLLSVSAHKFGGPQGAGFLYARHGVGLKAQLQGGGQQKGRRSGTLPSHQIVGVGLACELAEANREAHCAHLAACKHQLWQGLKDIDGIVCNSSEAACPHILNISVAGLHGQALLMGVTHQPPQLAVSAGSACSAARDQSSYVLRAMGLPPALAAATLRFSFGRTTIRQDIEQAIELTRQEIQRLRDLMPEALEKLQ